MARFGRAPGDCAICSSATIVLGETEAIAREKAEYLASLVPLEMVLATNSAMLGGDLSKISDEIELSRNKGHQGHGGLEDRIRQTMRAEGISFAEAIRRPRNMMVGTPPMNRRHHAGYVRVRSLRRVCADADDFAGHVGRNRPHADAGIATTRAASH